MPGEQFTAANCNQKLIGAQYYNAGWGGNAGIDAQLPWEFNSPRDFGGHGTHTAIDGRRQRQRADHRRGRRVRQHQRHRAARAHRGLQGLLGNRRTAAAASARTAWRPSTRPSPTASTSSTSRSAARTTNFRDAVEIAFLFAADAGVFVAASAGNSGPTTSTVAHPGPWLTTVAAGTHNRNGDGSVTLGNGVTYTGASVATPVSLRR